MRARGLWMLCAVCMLCRPAFGDPICGQVFEPVRPFAVEQQGIELLDGVGGVPVLVNIEGTRRRSLVVVSRERLHTTSYRSGATVHRAVDVDSAGGAPIAGDFDGDGCEDVALVGADRAVSVAWSNCAELSAPVAWVPPLGEGDPVSGDLNGDGLSDLLVIRSGGAWRALISEGRAGARRQGWVSPIETAQVPSRSFSDFDRDGRLDLLVISGEGVLTVAVSDGVKGFVAHPPQLIDFDRSRHFDRFYPGDFDGDGVTEQVGRDIRRNSLCYFRPGNAMITQCPMAQFLGETDWSEVVTGDFDGDGASELLVHRWRGKGWSRYRWRFDRGEEDRPILPIPEAHAVLLAGDVDGDGLDDLVVGESGVRWSFFRSRFSKPVEGVRVELGSGAFVLSDAEGKFCLGNSGPGQRLVRAVAEGRIDPAARFWQQSSKRRPAPANFLIDREATKGPQLCVGLVAGSWGRQGACPKGYAFFGLDDGRDPRTGPSSGPCCPLPAADIDVGEPFSAEKSCPESSILIGSEKRCPTCSYSLLCRKINADRYQLGAETEGAYWGFGFTRWDESHFIPKMSLPPNLRHAIGRTGFAEWDIDGCVGLPPGSLLTGRPEGYCSGTRFRQLQYRGIEGDPVAGTPVKMLAECREVVDLFSGGVRCKR